MTRQAFCRARGVLLVGATAALWSAAASAVRAIDIEGVQPAALDQPRINAYISTTSGGTPLSADFGGVETFNIQAFFDTGASGILLSSQTAEFLGIAAAQHNNQTIVFSDVGVGGSSNFNVSNPLYFGLAPYAPDANVDDPADLSAYTQTYGPMRTQIGPVGVTESNPLLEGLDVFGTPFMQGKVVVMNPKPVNSFLETMETRVYDRTAALPGDVATTHHIRVSHGNFDRFTQTTPAGAPSPTMADNPFIGPNPVANDGDDAPGVTIKYGASQATGSFLLDTGAAASIISSAMAEQLGISYVEGTEGSEDPVLQGLHPDARQFQLTIGGIGGTTKVAGFFLDEMILPTVEGIANPDENINFVSAPVLVGDISVFDPVANEALTLDGIFGMNFLVASAFVSEAQPFPIIDSLTFGAFDDVVYDHDGKTLGVSFLSGSDAQANINWRGSEGDHTWQEGGPSNFSVGFFSPVPYANGDHVVFEDFTFNDEAYTVDIVEPVAPGSVLINNSDEPGGVALFTFVGEAIRGKTGLTKKGSGTALFKNPNSYEGTTDIQSGTVIFEGSQNIGPVGVQSTGTLVIADNDQIFDELNIVGGTARFEVDGKVLTVESLDIRDSGDLDIQGSGVIVGTGSLSDVRDWIIQGKEAPIGGSRAGIFSSTLSADEAIGYVPGNLPGLDVTGTIFEGKTFDGDSVLIRVTLIGDSDLDGVVALDDLSRWAATYVGEPSSGSLAVNALTTSTAGGYWHTGDWDNDGDIDATDLALWVNAFQSPTEGLVIDVPGASDAAVQALAGYGIEVIPEPSTIGLLALGLLGLTRRRRRA